MANDMQNRERELLAAVDYILNRADEREIEVIAAALERKKNESKGHIFQNRISFIVSECYILKLYFKMSRSNIPCSILNGIIDNLIHSGYLAIHICDMCNVFEYGNNWIKYSGSDYKIHKK